jgi:hypothetical protein
MAPKVSPDEWTHGDDPQPFRARGIDGRLHQTVAKVMAPKRRGHLRVHEDERTSSALVLQVGNIPVLGQLESTGFSVVCYLVSEGRRLVDEHAGLHGVGGRIARRERLLERLVQIVIPASEGISHGR